jgi:hypothetical protein
VCVWVVVIVCGNTLPSNSSSSLLGVRSSPSIPSTSSFTFDMRPVSGIAGSILVGMSMSGLSVNVSLPMSDRGLSGCESSRKRTDEGAGSVCALDSFSSLFGVLRVGRSGFAPGLGVVDNGEPLPGEVGPVRWPPKLETRLIREAECALRERGEWDLILVGSGLVAVREKSTFSVDLCGCTDTDDSSRGPRSGMLSREKGFAAGDEEPASLSWARLRFGRLRWSGMWLRVLLTDPRRLVMASSAAMVLLISMRSARDGDPRWVLTYRKSGGQPHNALLGLPHVCKQLWLRCCVSACRRMCCEGPCVHLQAPWSFFHGL